MMEQLRKLSNHPLVDKKMRAEIGRVFEKHTEWKEYVERKPEIEAAIQATETHREDFIRFARDEKRLRARFHDLFAEEQFRPLRFSADDVQRAFDSVGPLPPPGEDDRFVNCVRKAILFLADQPRRMEIGRFLLLRLPEMVAANRLHDACMILLCAQGTLHDTDQSNPFLFEMFSHGHEAWTEQQQQKKTALLKQIGLDVDRMKNMSPDEIDDCMRKLESDPVLEARMDALIQDHPELKSQSADTIQEMEDLFGDILKRPDAASLLIPLEETMPWLVEFGNRMQKCSDRLPKPEDPTPDPKALKVMGELFWNFLGDMTKAIFTPERIGDHVTQLKDYRNKVFVMGEKPTVFCLSNVISSLEHETDPALNHFLNKVCDISVRKAMDEAKSQME